MKLFKIISMCLIVSSSLKGVSDLENFLGYLRDSLNHLERSLIATQDPYIPPIPKPQPPKIDIPHIETPKQPINPETRGKISRLDFPLEVNKNFASIYTLEQAIGKPIKVLSKDEKDSEIMGIVGSAQRVGVLVDDLAVLYPTNKYLFLFFLSPNPIGSMVEVDLINYAKEKNIELFIFDSDRDKREIKNTPHNNETLKRLNERIKQIYN